MKTAFLATLLSTAATSAAFADVGMPPNIGPLDYFLFICIFAGVFIYAVSVLIRL